MTIENTAELFLTAYRTGEPIEPPRELIENLDLDGAYRIQQLQEEAFVKDGHRILGRKIGLTSEAMQKQLGVDSPDFGFFTDRMVYTDGDTISAGAFIAPRVEPELGFRLSQDLPANATIEQVKDSIEGTYLAVEIIDSRVKDWDIRLVDTVADNASCGAIVIAENPLDISYDDLPSIKAEMSINGEVVGAGEGSAVMGHPLLPLQWLAHTLGAQGVPLQAGDLVLTGSFCGAAPFVAGDTLEVDYGAHGTLRATFN